MNIRYNVRNEIISWGRRCWIIDRGTGKLIILPPPLTKLFELKSFFAKSHICQLGVLGRYYYNTYSVRDHIIDSISIFIDWHTELEKKGKLFEDIADYDEVLLAIGAHDLRKPPGTPTTEPFQDIPHEDLSPLEEFKELCEKVDLNFERINNSIKGSGPYSVFLESEVDADKLAYISRELPYLNKKYGIGLNYEELFQDLLCNMIIRREGNSYEWFLKDRSSKVISTFIRYKKAMIKLYYDFLEPHIVTLEALTLRVIERHLEAFKSIINNPYATDIDLYRMMERLEPKMSKMIFQGKTPLYTSFTFKRDPRLKTLLDTPEYIKAELLKSAEKDNCLEFRRRLEEEIRRKLKVAHEDEIIVMPHIRVKKYFLFTRDPSHWKYSLKYETESGGLEDVATLRTFSNEIERLRKKEEIVTFSVTYPVTFRPNIRKLNWEELLVSIF